MNETYIISDPQVMMGKPVIKGTRITVELLLEKLAAGETFDQLLEDYLHLNLQSIQAAMAFAAGVLKNDLVYPIPAKSAQFKN